MSHFRDILKAGAVCKSWSLSTGASLKLTCYYLSASQFCFLLTDRHYVSSKLIIFDDGGGKWGPMVDLRPVFELRTGAATTQVRIERWLSRPATALWVTDAMVAAMAVYLSTVPSMLTECAVVYSVLGGDTSFTGSFAAGPSSP